MYPPIHDKSKVPGLSGIGFERLERTKIRTRLTAEGVIRPKWKHELSLFHAIRERYPDTLYQYRPEWLGRLESRKNLDDFSSPCA